MDQPTTRRRFLASLSLGLTLAPCWARPSSSAALPLPLAQPAPEGLDPAGYLGSEKYDGVRAYWDGRQLWFRSGLPVAAPAWFTAALPAVPLDGELWMDRGRFEALVGAVRRQQPVDAEWRAIRFMVFEMPGGAGRFDDRASRICRLLAGHGAGPAEAAPQQVLAGPAALQARLQAVVAAGGEGLMLHKADAAFVAGRTAALLKLKPLEDAEAQVIGHVPGRGRLVGQLGALRVRTVDGQVFLIGTGLNSAERRNPPPLGSWVTFTHRGLTERGLPRFASYLRLRTL